MNETLRYPILLVHGMGFRDRKIFCYWGRIPKVLKSLGAQVYFGGQDSNGSLEDNARYVAKRIDEILKETGARKVNIIAHSKGGLESRYLISTLGYGEKVASLTTISTPHHGSKTVDLLMRTPQCLVRVGAFVVDLWFGLLGDKHPKTYKAICLFKTDVAEAFNRDNLDDPQVYYQSYAFAMRSPWSDLTVFLPSLVVGWIEGENDGLLTPEAVKWGEFKGICRGNSRRGISHADEVDMRRRPLSRKKGGGISDITDLYRNIADDLRKRGY
jgi:triacylglycerol lipase